MGRKRLNVLPLAAALAACLLAGSSRAQTPWYVSYERALSAQEQGDWKGSITLLGDAVAAKQSPKLKAKTYGLRFVNYLPYFHIGEAYYHLHEKQKAVENYDLCLKYGEIQQAPDELSLLMSHRAALAGEPAAAVAPPPPAASPEPAETGASVSPGGLPWYVSYETGLAYIESGDWLNAIDNLKTALGANGIPRRYARTYGMWFIAYIPYYYLGVAYYNQGMWQLAVNYFETSERLGEVTDLEPESSTLRSDLEDARRKSAGGRKGVSEELKAGVSNRIAEAVRLFNQQEYAKAETVFRSVLVIDPYNSVARSYIARIGKQSETGAGEPPPPREFSDGVLELLKGRHEQAIRLLKIAAAGMEQDAGLHAYLGVAYCLRHRAAGKKERESLRSAQSEFRRALGIDPSYTLDRTLFSKDVIDIFQGVRKK
jgi:tetratricopeptide (TPR) repeat protein